MRKGVIILLIIAGFLGAGESRGAPAFREITRDDLRDRIAAFWYGQLVGNYLGFPFESRYKDSPVPVLVDRYYDYRDAVEKYGLDLTYPEITEMWKRHINRNIWVADAMLDQGLV